MESPIIYIMILLLNVFEFSSGVIYNKYEKKNHFACSSEEVHTDKNLFKLFLSTDSLKVYCFFRNQKTDTSREILSVFTSGGHAPKLIIMNSTYHGHFHFNLSLINNRTSWLMDIPRERITVNTDIESVEEWIIKVTMHEGLNIYDTEGTLLDLVREPILQWNLGAIMNKAQVKKLHPHVTDIKVAKCPCANDVALLGLILNETFNGVFIGRTSSGFWEYNEIIWYNLTQNIYSQLKDEHKGLTIIDMVLTNHFLVILTSLGLYVSTDLRYPDSEQIQLSRADFCGFERVDYIKGKLWYNERCFANRENFEVDYVTITFDRNRTLSESSSCFYSKEPFLQWLPCLSSTVKNRRFIPHVVTFLIDQESQTGIYLFHIPNSKRTFVSVSVLKDDKPNETQPKFPNFKFPSSFSNPVGMVFHPRSHFLYVYGNQVWLSEDGGNSFDLLCDFLSNFVRKTVHSFYTSDITFITQSGKIYMTKAGLTTYTLHGNWDDKVFTIYYDHLGFIHKLTPELFDTDSSSSDSQTSNRIFGKPPDLGFNTALAPQYITPNEMIFFAYVPLTEPNYNLYRRKFKSIHLGKVINHRGGEAYITKLFIHTNGPLGFHTSALTEIVEPFPVESNVATTCIYGSLNISYTGNIFYQISITTQGHLAVFSNTDVEMTVVSPGYSSFLITHIVDEKNALSMATMPHIITSTLYFPVNSWFLYNFGTTTGRTWNISVRPCNYWVQQDDNDVISPSIVKYIDMGNEENYEIKLMPITKGMRILHIPPVGVIVGNPALLEVTTEGYFDITDSYHMKVHIASKFFQKGSTSLALVVWEASSQCYLTTLVPTMKSSCSYLRTMHHIPGRHIPPEHWISGVHKDSQGFNMIKTLPVNYRPPSNMGVYIPLTDNFYHADPSKPKPRSLFHKSKETGKYKQCANARDRAMCNCTEHQKFSHAVAFSDCKEKVHRFKFPVTQYPVVLEIIDEKQKLSVKPPYLVTMTEVNRRQNWQLKHNMPENVKKMKNYLDTRLKTPVYNPFGLNLSIRGSELFHFKVSVIPGVSFCDLHEEFQIYVDEVPLPFPGHVLIAVATSVVLGGLIFVAFLFQLRNIHPLRAFRRYVRGTIAHSSNLSIDS